MRRLLASRGTVGKWIMLFGGVFIAGCVTGSFEYPEPVLLAGLPTGVDRDAFLFYV